MRNLDLLPALKFHCTTKMEVVEKFKPYTWRSPQFPGNLWRTSKGIAACLEKHLCDNRGCTERGLFTTDSRNLFWSEWQHHLNGRQYGCSRGKPVRAPSNVLKCLSYANQMQRALLRAITNEKGLIYKSFKIYSFTFSFRWNVQYYSVCNKSIASTANDLLFNSYISKESSHTGSQPSQI